MFQLVIPLLTRPKRSLSLPISRGSVWPRLSLVKIADKLAMAVLPADCRVDFGLLKDVTGEDKIELASEREFEDSFPDCDVGAMSPFGNLYGLEVYAAGSLAKNEEIVFNAGTHSEIIRLAYKDFANLAKPKVANFSYFASV